ncbi:MAG: hypothetical protein SWY16_10160 [Cyanobacteriota bacterium]|nr:hypothetical protein [Cyanobacteriota bacterium]
MSKKTINLTRLAVEEELDSLLECDPYQSTRSEFVRPKIRKALLDEVVSQIPSRQIEIETPEEEVLPELLHCVSTQKRLKIEMLLQEGIQNRLTQWNRWHNLQVAPNKDSCRVPSRCFG